MNEACKYAPLHEKSSFILDAEIVATGANGQFLPFQSLSGRARKNVSIADIKVPVAVMVFDLLFLERSLLTESLTQRLAQLHQLHFRFPTQLITSDPVEAETLLDASIKAGCEGLMMKESDTTYEPDKRHDGWVKLKKDYTDLGDTLDVVPIGAWWGTGRKCGWYSPILLAVWNKETETLESLCKCISGFTDEYYKQMLVKYSEAAGTILPKAPANVSVPDSLQPNLWFTPMEVWEVLGAEFSLSPIQETGSDLLPDSCGGRGLSLRFPRFLKVRDDKKIEDATTTEQIVEMFLAQPNRSVDTGANDDI